MSHIRGSDKSIGNIEVLWRNAGVHINMERLRQCAESV